MSMKAAAMVWRQSPHDAPLSAEAPPRVARLSNAGSEIWLYVAQHLGVVVESGVLDSRDPLGPTKYRALAKQGVLTGCLVEPSPLTTVSVHVHVPRSQPGHGGWRPPATALLEIPSGRLCIEGRERVLDAPERALAPSAVVWVPPGRYHVSLHACGESVRADCWPAGWE